MIGRLEEFPSLKSPSARETNPQRRKKRRLILYSFYVFSVVAMYRLVTTMYWLYTLDIKNLCVRKVTYDTDSWQRVSVDLTFENSQSPLHVKFTDISASLFCVDKDGCELQILTLRVPTANLTKNRNIVFHGDIYIEDFNKENAIASRSSVRFVVRVDAQMYPRLCFLRFPFRRSSDFSLKNPVSAPSKGIAFKRITVEETKDMLAVNIEVDNSKFTFPRFMELKTNGMVLCSKDVDLEISMTAMEVVQSELMKSPVLQLAITRENGAALKTLLARVFRGDEVGFELDYLCLRDANKKLSQERFDLGLRFGFNARDPSKYHMVLNGGPPQALPCIPLIMLGAHSSAELDVWVWKCMVPCIDDASQIALPDNSRLNAQVRLEGCNVGNIAFAIGMHNEYITLKGRVGDIRLQSVMDVIRRRIPAHVEFVLQAEGKLGFLLDGIAFRCSRNGMEMSFGDVGYRLADEDGQSAARDFDVIHSVFEEDRRLCLETVMDFGPLEECRKAFHLVDLSEHSFSMREAGLDAEFAVLGSSLKYARGSGHWMERMFGSISFRIRMEGDMKSALDAVTEYVGSSGEPRNLVEALIRSAARSGSGQGVQAGKVFVRHETAVSTLLNHVLTVSLEPAIFAVPGLVVRNRIRIPNMDLQLEPLHENGFIPRMGDARTMKNASRLGHRPVRLKIEAFEAVYGWSAQGSWLELGEGVRVSVVVQHVHDVVVLVTRGFNVGYSGHSGDVDVVSRDMAQIANRYLKMKKTKTKRSVEKKIGFDLNIEKLVEDLFQIAMRVSVPVEMVETVGVQVGLPRIRVAMTNETENDQVAVDKTFFEMEGRMGEDSPGFRSMELMCTSSPFPPETLKTTKGGKVVHSDVFMNICIDTNNRRHVLQMSRVDFKNIMADIRMELMGGDGNGPRPTLRIDSEHGFEVFRTERGLSTWDAMRRESKRWEMEFCNEGLKGLLFSKLPTVLLNSVFQTMPAGLVLNVNVGDGAVGLHVDSPVRNRCWEDCGQKLAFWKDPRSSGYHGDRRFYKVVDVVLGQLSLSNTVTFDFSPLRGRDGQIEFVSQYTNPAMQTAEYRRWSLGCLFDLDVEFSNDGMIHIPDCRVSSPLILILTSLLPGHDPYNMQFQHMKMWMQFPLPFDFILPCENPVLRIALCSKRNGYRGFVSLQSVPSEASSGGFFFELHIPSSSSLIAFSDTWSRYISKSIVMEHVSVAVFLNGAEVYRCNNHHIVIATADLHSLVGSTATTVLNIVTRLRPSLHEE